MITRFAAIALASVALAGAAGCGAGTSAPDAPVATDTPAVAASTDVAEQAALYLIDARMIGAESDEVVAHPRIMTLEGEPARITTASGDEATYDMELVVTTCGGAQCLTGGLVIDGGGRRGEWAFQMMFSDGDTVAFTLEEPLPLRYEVTIGRVSDVDGAVENPPTDGEREVAATIPLVWPDDAQEPLGTPLRTAPPSTPPAPESSPR